MHEKGPYKGLTSDRYGFLSLIAVGTSKSLQDVDTGYSPGDQIFDMGIEFEVRVEYHSQFTKRK